jgi:anti-sigma regulatory factor (Ser/Thr protein kinase)
MPFIRDGLEDGSPILVMVPGPRVDLLRAHLDRDADTVHFADIEDVGRNPARIIPAWRDFVSERGDGRAEMRGIGEPSWSGRTADELIECQRHEWLINLAFADAHGFRLLCPYDSSALDPSVLEAAHDTHPVIASDGDVRTSPHYLGVEDSAGPFDGALPDAPDGAGRLRFDAGTLEPLRRYVFDQAIAASLSPSRAADLVLAANELATNSVRHADGLGVLQVWQTPDALVCDVRDDGCIRDRLVGRVRPAEGQADGFGLWLVNQVCDLVQVRSSPSRTVVRLHMRRV